VDITLPQPNTPSAMATDHQTLLEPERDQEELVHHHHHHLRSETSWLGGALCLPLLSPRPSHQISETLSILFMWNSDVSGFLYFSLLTLATV
jgi:hypothetical protein